MSSMLLHGSKKLLISYAIPKCSAQIIVQKRPTKIIEKKQCCNFKDNEVLCGNLRIIQKSSYRFYSDNLPSQKDSKIDENLNTFQGKQNEENAKGSQEPKPNTDYIPIAKILATNHQHHQSIQLSKIRKAYLVFERYLYWYYAATLDIIEVVRKSKTFNNLVALITNTFHFIITFLRKNIVENEQVQKKFTELKAKVEKARHENNPPKN